MPVRVISGRKFRMPFGWQYGWVLDISGPYPFHGEVIWLTEEQGGRIAGPPQTEGLYASIAHLPPHTVATGSASFVLRGFDPSVSRSSAEGRWLIVENTGAQHVVPGSVVTVTEGARVVAFFIVKEVLGDAEDPRRNRIPIEKPPALIEGS